MSLIAGLGVCSCTRKINKKPVSTGRLRTQKINIPMRLAEASTKGVAAQRLRMKSVRTRNQSGKIHCRQTRLSRWRPALRCVVSTIIAYAGKGCLDVSVVIFLYRIVPISSFVWLVRGN